MLTIRRIGVLCQPLTLPPPSVINRRCPPEQEPAFLSTDREKQRSPHPGIHALRTQRETVEYNGTVTVDPLDEAREIYVCLSYRAIYVMF
jgi:hypothetical protein